MDTSLRSEVVPAPSRAPSRYRTTSAALVAEVRDGLLRRQRELPATFLADRDITEVRRAVELADDARLRDVEAPLVRAWATEHRRRHDLRRVVELMPAGSTSAHELLPSDGGRPVDVYLAVDDMLDRATEGATRVGARYPGIVALSMAANPTLTLPVRRANATVFALLGGGLGRFTPVAAVRVLRALRAAMSLDDHLLLGIDLQPIAGREPEAPVVHELRQRLHRHALVVANRDLGTDFAVDAFRYEVLPTADQQRRDEGLQCPCPIRVASPSLGAFVLRPGELLRTGVTCRYGRSRLDAMLRGVGLALQQWQPSPDGSHALADAVVRFPDDGQA